MKKLLASKQIKLIHFEYKNLLIYICKEVIAKHFGVPLEAEDIYYELLYNVPSIMEKFDSKKGSLKTFIAVYTKNFARSKCKSWSTRSHRVMNSSYQLTYEVSREKEEKIKIDTRNFTFFEKRIYKYVILEEMPITKVARALMVSEYKIKKILNDLKTKIYYSLQN